MIGGRSLVDEVNHVKWLSHSLYYFVVLVYFFLLHDG